MDLLQAEKLLAFQVASEKAEAEMKSISLLRDDLARVSSDFHDVGSC